MLTYYLFGNAPASASNSRMEYAEVAELADALDSKSSVVPYVPVRVRPSAPVKSRLHAVCVKLIFLVKCILTAYLTADYIFPF